MLSRALPLLIVSAGLALAQRADFSISGTVVNSVTGEPVKGALVVLSGFLDAPLVVEAGIARRSHDPINKMAFTGPSGEFRFEGLTGGVYTPVASKPGLTPGSPPIEPIWLEGSLSNLRLTLDPLGSIQVTVRDQYGDPISSATVLALRRVVQQGFRSTTQDRSATTDDRGMVRFWNLVPGNYYVLAAGKPGAIVPFTGTDAPIYDAWESYAPTYAGGGMDLASATSIAIRPGTNAEAAVSVRLEPAVKIRGKLDGFDPKQIVTFELTRGSEPGIARRASLNTATGRFEVQDVLPGAYILRASQPGSGGSGGRLAETHITVGARDVQDAALTLYPGATVRATVPQPTPIDRGDGHADVRSCQVRLLPETPPILLRTLVGAESSVELGDVAAGTYEVIVECFGGYPSSVQAGTQDMLANPRLVIQPGVDPPTIQVAAAPGGGMIDGTVKTDSPDWRAPIGVLVVPSAGTKTAVRFTNAFLDVSTGGAHFFANALPPGDYVVYAFAPTAEVPYREPDFVGGLTGGTRVHVDSGATVTLALEKVLP